ncbi:MAG: hypothetical protein KDC87_09195 [Planctomycetes bacterium]|nr:hypothetical protein [Planctomycetota bacterium]MCB9869654.1 hypothetical protein [Planctomycetota bacterium]
MLSTALALALLLPQTPDAPVRPGAAQQDEIELTGGETIQGKIVQEVGNYIEVRIGPSTVVGFERSRIARIRRGSAAGPTARPPALPARDDWFLLHDAEGRTVGYLHSAVQVQEDETVHLSEEWLFNGQRGTTRVTLLEVAEPNLRPRSCFYHERVLDRAGRVRSEQLRLGKVNAERLVVETRSFKGVERKSYAFPAAMQLPLLYRERLRRLTGVQVHATQQNVFDVRTGEFCSCEASAGARKRVQLRGAEVSVRELVVRNATHDNAEWIDGHANVVRREINGPSLVAVRVDRARALAAEGSRAALGFGQAVAASKSGRLALWLPSPTWHQALARDEGVAIEAPLYGATATLFELDQLGAGAQLETAADAVERWLRLAIDRQLRIVERAPAQFRRGAAIRLEVAWETRRPGAVEHHAGTCHVLLVDGRFVALLCTAPRRRVAGLEREFHRILGSVQLRPGEIAPLPPPGAGDSAPPVVKLQR